MALIAVLVLSADTAPPARAWPAIEAKGSCISYEDRVAKAPTFIQSVKRVGDRE